MRKGIALSIFLWTLSSIPLLAQGLSSEPEGTKLNVFNHLDLSVVAGTEGIGLDVAAPLGNMFQVRAGYSFVPHIEPNMYFGIEGGKIGDDGKWVSTKFEKMAAKLEELTGYSVDDQITMKGEPNFHNFKLLVDVFPFHNKHWHFTTGFYWGASTVAKAYNTTEDMPSLLAVGIYNNIYNKVLAGEPIIGDDIYLSPDYEDKIKSYGRMGIHMGDKVSDGTPYMMEPDANGMVKARIKVNSFRPYLGAGYGGALLKNNDKYSISCDLGVLFWGGKPQIITHDGTDLARDVRNVGGKAGDYVDVIKKFTVYPIINVRLTRRLF